MPCKTLQGEKISMLIRQPISRKVVQLLTSMWCVFFYRIEAASPCYQLISTQYISLMFFSPEAFHMASDVSFFTTASGMIKENKYGRSSACYQTAANPITLKTNRDSIYRAALPPSYIICKYGVRFIFPEWVCVICIMYCLISSNVGLQRQDS